jgi:hypothetical protein
MALLPVPKMEHVRKEGLPTTDHVNPQVISSPLPSGELMTCVGSQIVGRFGLAMVGMSNSHPPPPPGLPPGHVMAAGAMPAAAAAAKYDRSPISSFETLEDAKVIRGCSLTHLVLQGFTCVRAMPSCTWQRLTSHLLAFGRNADVPSVYLSC